MIIFKTLEEYGEFFQNIPTKAFCKGRFKNERGQMCGIGLLTNGEGDFDGANFLHPIRRSFFEGMEFATINNGHTIASRQLGTTPKERILNAITLKIALGEDLI